MYNLSTRGNGFSFSFDDHIVTIFLFLLITSPVRRDSKSIGSSIL
jgi:hypothetical protein